MRLSQAALTPRREPSSCRWEYRPRSECRNATAYYLRYVLTEPRDAAYALPLRVACRLFGRHNATCRGRLDHQRRRSA